MKNNMNEWQRLISEIREWDRSEHDWASTFSMVDKRNRVTKNQLAHKLMKKYKLQKRKSK